MPNKNKYASVAAKKLVATIPKELLEHFPLKETMTADSIELASVVFVEGAD